MQAALARRQQYLPLVQQEAARAGVPWQLLDAMIWQESRYDPEAVGDAGASWGLGQLQRAAAIDAGIDPDQRMDPLTNIRGAANYAAIAYRNAQGDPRSTAALYNANAHLSPDQVSPSSSAWSHADRVMGHAAALGTQIPGFSPGGEPIAPGAQVQSVGATLGLGSLGQFRGVDFPEPPQLPQVSTALNLPQAAAASPPQPRQMSFREILRYADLEPFDWYPG